MNARTLNATRLETVRFGYGDTSLGTIAVAVPCHRVVKSDGSISGYRWGVQRKRRLINVEGVS